MAKAPTKREMFQRVFAILTDAGNVEEAEFVAAQIALLDKRAAAPRTPTKDQLANVALKDDIVAILDATDEALRANEIAKVLGEDVTVQKATALLRQLVLDNRVKRVEDGKVVRFTTA